MQDELRPLRRVMFGSAQIFSSNAVVSLLGLVNTILFARYLDPREYGKALAMVAGIGALTGWGGLGLEDFLSADIARESGEGRDGAARKLLRQYTGVRIVTTIALVIGLLTFGRFTTVLGLPAGRLKWALLMLAVGRSLGFVNQTAFFSQQRFRLAASSAVIEASVRTTIALTILLGVHRSSALVVTAYGAGALIGAAALFPALRRSLEKQVNNRDVGLRLRDALTRHGKWALISNLINRSSDPALNLALVGAAGPAALATYRVASRLVEVLQMPITAVTQVLGPVVANSLDSARAVAARMTKYSLALAMLLSILGSLLVRPLISILFPSSYMSSATVALVLMPVLISLALRVRQRPLFYALRRQDLILVSYALLVPLEIGLSGAAARLWGVIGFAIVRMAATFGIFVVREYQLRNSEYKFPLADVVRVDALDWMVMRRVVARIIPKTDNANSKETSA